MTASSEMERLVKPAALSAEPVEVKASDAERAALAQRFGVTAIHELTAAVGLFRDSQAVSANGRLEARIEQPCAITGEEFTYTIEEPVCLRFVPVRGGRDPESGEEVELDREELDEIEFGGDAFDLGEAIAQTLGLAIDPYREGPDADAVRIAKGIQSDEDPAPSGALAEALAKLRED